MKTNISILLVEDNKMDAKVILMHLEEGGFPVDKITIVDNEPKYIEALKNKPQIILSDFKLPIFSGLLALKIRNDMCYDTPFIIVTGSDKEESAIECMKLGADDYVLKSHRHRLTSAIQNAISKKKTEKVNEIILQITEVALNMNDIDTVMNFIYQKLNELIYAKNMFIAIYDNRQEKYDFLFFKDEKDDVNRFSGNDTKKSFTEYVRTTGQPLLADEKMQDELTSKGLIEMVGTPAKEWIGIPLRYENKIIGVLSVQNHTDELLYSKNDLKYLDMLSGTLALIITRKLADYETVKRTKAIDFSPAITIITDSDGNIEYINPAFEKITGFSVKLLLNKKLSVFDVENDSTNFYKKIESAVKNGKSFAGEFQSHRKTGERFWASVNLSPIKDKNDVITNYIIISQDITSRKNTEHELLKALTKAEESDRLKSNFLSIMSHEIRTPLNQILGFSEMLANDTEINANTKKEYSDIVLYSGYRLLSLITNIVEMAKIQSKNIKTEFRPFNIYNSFLTLHSNFKLVLNQQGKTNLSLAFVPDKLTKKMCWSDESKIELIMNNLLDNAIKFTETGSVSFGYSFQKQDNDTGFFTFFVKDTGIGIDEKYKNLIYDKFRQIDERKTRNYDGSGIGLSVCSSLVNLLNGEISFESELGKGTTFYVKIPDQKDRIKLNEEIERKKEYVTLQQLKSIIATANQDKNILLVATSKYVINKIKFWTKTLNIKLVVANDKQSAISIIKNNGNVTLILIDFTANINNEQEIAMTIKRITAHIPLIAILTHSLSVDKKILANAGFDDFLIKPLTISNVKTVLLKFYLQSYF